MTTPTEILKKYWGYPAFRPLQGEIISHVLAGKDVLALLPTGGGKSLCYQVPALMMEGLTIVISPLIALMKDQVGKLKSLDIKAEAIYTGLSPLAVDRILENARFGKTKLLYVSPERLKSPLFMARFEQMNVKLIAVDEAHCISQWGHDFRPSYLDIGQLREVFPKTPILALTASATREVRDEILEKLVMRSPVLVRDSFARPNLRYHVMEREDILEHTIKLLRRMDGSAIVYVRNRRKCLEMAHWLTASEIDAAAYHGGMAMDKRDTVQQAWISNQTKVIVATNAFGMGVDKPDVRLVIHYDIPPSLEDYYQEAGRAGRDGQEAFCILLTKASSVRQLKTRVEKSFPELEAIAHVYKCLHIFLQTAVGAGQWETYDFDLDEFCKRFYLKAGDVYVILDILARDGWIVFNENAMRGSTFILTTDADTLYTYQVAEDKINLVTKALLRMYEGLWSSTVPIDERKIAKSLQWQAEDVKKWLLRLHALGLADYKVPSGKNQVTLLRERVPEQFFTIDHKAYAFRKERAMARLDSMLGYLANDVPCREMYIRQYFDETDIKPCGHCDRCRQDNIGKSPLDVSVYEQLTDLNGILLKDFLHRYRIEQHSLVKKELQQLSDEHRIRIAEDRIFLKKP